ncbi:MAG: response receiver-modulated cyclic diguanylate phosphodiesterase [Deltaproteobacteria bacterium]|nr:response receiver-modulated cyclic diguanylate phosphodiesterase [Deltaproteobacteria bacterium]
MDKAVLIVAAEANIPDALARLFVGRDVRVLRAGNGEEALGIVRREPVAVVVSDDLMPGMRGVELLSRVRDRSPDTVRVLLVETAGLPAATEAIDRGEVSRFHVKPWVDEEIVRTVEEGLWRYLAVRSLRPGDEAALYSIAQTIELRDPYTRGHCDRMATFALKIAEGLSLPEEMRRAIRHGSWLHDCGKIGVPEAILNRPGKLSAADFEVVRKHPGWGAEIGRQANLPEGVINIILYHHEQFDGRGYPTGAKGTEIPLEARIVAVVDIFDAMSSDRPYAKGYEREEVMRVMGVLRGAALDPQLVDIFLADLSP